MSTENQNQEKHALLQITLRALRDADFKKRLMTNPAEAIKEIFPDFEANSNIIVQDQTAKNTVYINISPLAAAELYENSGELELCEEDLELVAGGKLDFKDIDFFCGCFQRGCSN